MNMRWNLDPLYTDFNSEKFQNDLTKLDDLLLSFNSWANSTLSKDAAVGSVRKTMENYIKQATETGRLFYMLYAYSELVFSVEADHPEASKYVEILGSKLPEITKAESAFTSWLSKIEDLKKETEGSETLSEHLYFLMERKESSRYLLTPGEEILAARLKNSGSSSWTRLWNILTSTVSVDMELNGEKTTLPLAAARNLAYSPDRETRKSAYSAELKAYEKFDESAAACLNGIKGEVITISERRGYESPLDMTLRKSRMKKESLDAMFTAIREYLPVFHSYFNTKSRILGYSSGLPFYELFAPVGNADLKFSYPEAKDFIIRNFSSFSLELSDYAERAFREEWIDAEQRPGKRGGAFCNNLHPIGESRIMSNFDGSLNGVTTLAHELGHGYHGDCLNGETFLNSDYPMPLAESASIFSETLILNAALSEASPEQAYTILEDSIRGNTQIIVDIYSRFLFESEVFEKRRSSSLSVGELKEIMIRSQKSAYGAGLDPDLMHPYMWACKPHYYEAEFNYYNFPYSFGLLFALGLYSEYRKNREAFVPLYTRLLKETGKNTVEAVARMAGIDTTSPEFWKSSLEILAEDIRKFRELADKI